MFISTEAEHKYIFEDYNCEEHKFPPLRFSTNNISGVYSVF